MRSVGVLGAMSSCLPSVAGSTETFCVGVSVTSSPCSVKKPFSLATQAGSHDVAGIYAARTAVLCTGCAGTKIGEARKPTMTKKPITQAPKFRLCAKDTISTSRHSLILFELSSARQGKRHCAKNELVSL